MVEEVDETCFWIYFAAEGALVDGRVVADLAAKGRELTAIFVASRRTAALRSESSRCHRAVDADRGPGTSSQLSIINNR